uniref:Pentatricopeptide repeat-containing protein n=1 Tax=Vitis vinifera TaxID=29760 RepID=F6HIZ1_VITVI
MENAGCSKAGRLEEGLRLCERMMERGLVPSCWAFNLMAGKLCESGVVKRADEITYSNLIASYGKLGEFQQVLKLYYEMEYRSLSPGLLVFESLIRSLCQCRKLEKTEKYLRIMKDRSIAISTCVYETLISGYFEKGDELRASQLNNEMVSRGLKPSCSYMFHP